MSRTFSHSFEPKAKSPIRGKTAHLTVREIEDAGIKEMLQTAGARVSSWSILDALLQPGEDAFRFREPLGVAREVKVAASGLFGRFVARAYLERYMGLSVFAHLGPSVLSLDGKLHVEVRRKPGKRGDLPDWIACASDLGSITVAEAKGTHDKPGPQKTLQRAWQQVGRVNVVSAGRRLPLKRIAIATRWASKRGGSKTPIIAVQDPMEAGDEDAPAHSDQVGVGIARLHVASLLEPLGYGPLASAIRDLTRQDPELAFDGDATDRATRLLHEARSRQIVSERTASGLNDRGLVGALVTRAGPIPGRQISPQLANRLQELKLRPMFVGIGRHVIEAVIAGDPMRVRAAMPQKDSTDESIPAESDATFDTSGTFLVPLDDRERIV